MERTRGEKGKPGETDRQIVFTIVINEGTCPEGLTKREISTIIENATGKEQEGIKRHLDNILSSEDSTLKGILAVKNDAGKKRYRIVTENLRDVARLYKFLIPDQRLFGVLRDRMFSDLNRFLIDVVDYLYLWDPEDPIYGLPRELRESWVNGNYFEFFPRLYPSGGPVRLKEKAQKYGVIDSVYHSILKGIVEEEYLPGISRFSELIAGLDSFISQEYKGIERIKRYLDSESNIADSVKWFMVIWSEAWVNAVNFGISIAENTSGKGFETIEDIAHRYDVPPGHVSHGYESIEHPLDPSLDTEQESFFIRFPIEETPVIPEYFYRGIKFVGDKYEFRPWVPALEVGDMASTEKGAFDTDWVKEWILIK